MAKKKINNALRDQFLIENNFSYSSILFEDFDEPHNSKQRVLPVFRGDANSNMLIYYPTLNGSWAKHYNKQNLHTSYRTRLKEQWKDSKGDEHKYLMEGKNRIFFPPEMLRAFLLKTEIPILVVTEGEKKAWVGCKNGFDVVAVSGIWNFCREVEGKADDQKELMPELKEFIKDCKVKIVVFLQDSDALDISTKYFNEASNKSATDRPGDFFAATKRFAELVFQEGCQFFHSYINPHKSDKKLGLDDLIQQFETHKGEYEGLTGLPILAKDFYDSVTGNKFCSYFNTTQIQFIQNSFIKQIFKLTDAYDFFNYHKKLFQKHNLKQFRFERQTFEIESYIEGKIKEIKAFEQKQVWENNGCYYAVDLKGTSRLISNFTMNVLFLLKSGTNPKRIVEFQNTHNQKFVSELTMDELVSITNFRKRLIGKGSFIFKGEMPEMLNLQEMLFREERAAVEITSLGWQKTYAFYAFANGVALDGRFYPVDEYGVVNVHGEKYYLPAFSSLVTSDEEQFANEKKFAYKPSDVTFNEWCNQFLTVYKDNGALAMSFVIASLFYDFIVDIELSFPILNPFGIKGSGKNTIVESVLHLFGKPQHQISLESESSTKKGIYRKYMQFHNAIVWLDEYKNTLDRRMIGMLKGLFDRSGYEKAQTSQDNRTHTTTINSATILSGQDMPNIEPALFSRVLLLPFQKNEYNEAEKTNLNTLRDIEKRGLTDITLKILAHRELIKSNYVEEAKNWQVKFSTEFKYEATVSRIIRNSVICITPISILIKHKIIELPYTIDVLYTKFVSALRYHNNVEAATSETSDFWSTIEVLFSEKAISAKNGDFKFISTDAIAIRFNFFHSKYLEKQRREGKTGIDRGTLINYLKNSAAFIELKEQVKYQNGQNSSGFVFTYSKLGINLKTDDDIIDEMIEKSKEKVEDAEPKPIKYYSEADKNPF